MKTRREILLLVLLALLAVAGPRSLSAEGDAPVADLVRTAGGEQLQGRILSVSEDGRVKILPENSETVVETDVASLKVIDLNAQRRLPRDYFKRRAVFRLSDGARITGTIKEWGGDFVTITNEYCTASIARQGIVGMAFGSFDSAVPYNEGKSDIIVLNEKPDEKVECEVISVSELHVKFKAGGAEREAGQADVRLISFAGAEKPARRGEKNGWYAGVSVANGDRMTGVLSCMDEETLTLITQYAGALSLKRKLLDKVAFSDSPVFSSGRFLVCDLNGNRVTACNDEGKAIWEYRGCQNPWDAIWLDNGTALVVSMDDNSIRILDEAGKEITKIQPGLSSPRAAVLLENGNYLVAEQDGNSLAEVTPGGEIKARHFSGDVINPMRIRLTRDGEVLVAEYGINRVTKRSLATGKTTWSRENLSGIYGAREMGNGYVAVLSDQGRSVRAYDRDGNEKWKVNTNYNFYDVGVTPEGNAIVPVKKNVNGRDCVVLTECSCEDGKVVRETPLEGRTFNLSSIAED